MLEAWRKGKLWSFRIDPWGGLQPIPYQVVVDVLGSLSLLTLVCTKPTVVHAPILIATLAGTIGAAGSLTHRWPMTFPMIPLTILQGLRFHFYSAKELPVWLGRLLGASSLYLIGNAVAFSLLFPPLQIPDTQSKAPYQVGVVDTFVPVTKSDPQTKNPTHVAARIFYPTLESTSQTIPYLRKDTAHAYCEETLKAGAPPQLHSMGWLLHTLLLATTQATRSAPPISTKDSSIRLPIIIVSHGLGSNLDLYTYQTRHLAAQGFLVVLLDHNDGSAVVTLQWDGSLLRQSQIDLSSDVSDRCRQTEVRAQQMVDVVDFVQTLHQEDLLPVSFVGQLNMNQIHYMGHSFGGATAIHAAHLRPPTSVVAHDPAMEWLPDQSRDVWWNSKKRATPALLLFSSEWATSGTEQPGSKGIDRLVEEYSNTNSSTILQVIPDCHHGEFTDIGLMMPSWYTRRLHLVGSRGAASTSWDIHQRTLAFLQTIQQ